MKNQNEVERIIYEQTFHHCWSFLEENLNDETNYDKKNLKTYLFSVPVKITLFIQIISWYL